MKRVITVVAMIAFITTVFAQDKPAAATNSASLTAPPVKYPWESSVSVGLTMTRGNSDTTLFTSDFQTQKKTPDNEYSLGAGGAYGDQSSKETVNNYKGFGQWNHLFTDRFYSYIRAEAMRDVIANLDYRVTVGPGAGYYLLKLTNTTLAVEAGGAYEAQHFNGESSDEFATVRFAEHGEHKFNTRARVWEKVEILPQVDKFDNYVVNAEIGVEAALTKSFSLKTYLDDLYQHEPAPGKLKNDAELVAALSYKF